MDNRIIRVAAVETLTPTRLRDYAPNLRDSIRNHQMRKRSTNAVRRYANQGVQQRPEADHRIYVVPRLACGPAFHAAERIRFDLKHRLAWLGVLIEARKG